VEKYDVLIIGGGPAGVFCAISLKEKNKNLNIAIIEKNKLLTKLLLSGGGRCNLSNKKANSDLCLNYYPRGARFISHLFHQYDCNDFCDWLKENKVEIKIEEEEKIFLKSDDSGELEKIFIKKLVEYKINVIYGEFIDFEKDDTFKTKIKIKEEIKIYYSNFLVIACGSNINLLEVVKRKDINVNDFIPSLYGFYSKTIAKENLAGISLKDIDGYLEFNEKIDSQLNNKKTKREQKIKVKADLLFTHEGLSGPLILKLSSYYALRLFENNFYSILILDFFPEKESENLSLDLLKYCHQGAKLIKNICYDLKIPFNLWIYLLKKAEIPYDKKAAQISREESKKIIQVCKNFQIIIDGKSQNKDEFVSAGGIDLKEIKNNCESKKIEKLFFIGEILDIDGITGGYNLQSCWTTAFIAADSIAKSFFQNQQ